MRSRIFLAICTPATAIRSIPARIGRIQRSVFVVRGGAATGVGSGVGSSVGRGVGVETVSSETGIGVQDYRIHDTTFDGVYPSDHFPIALRITLD